MLLPNVILHINALFLQVDGMPFFLQKNNCDLNTKNNSVTLLSST